MEETVVPGVLLCVPEPISDHRGRFYESVRITELEKATGRPFQPQQVSYSVSRRNTLRGIHSVTTPPGQAKFVTCVRGAIRDVAVDLRTGSSGFGRYTVNVLAAEESTAVFIPEGVGHGFVALGDDTCVCYVLSTAHVPGTQIDIDPFDPELAIDWGLTEAPVMSDKDARAQSLGQAHTAGLLTVRENVS